MVDCKTDWPDTIEMCKDTTTTKLIDALRDQFCHTTVSNILWSDGGPQFTSAKLANFLKELGVSHCTSSPRYSQSNGKAEAAVKSMKKLISSAAWTECSIQSHSHGGELRGSIEPPKSAYFRHVRKITCVVGVCPYTL